MSMQMLPSGFDPSDGGSNFGDNLLGYIGLGSDPGNDWLTTFLTSTANKITNGGDYSGNTVASSVADSIATIEDQILPDSDTVIIGIIAVVVVLLLILLILGKVEAL